MRRPPPAVAVLVDVRSADRQIPGAILDPCDAAQVPYIGRESYRAQGPVRTGTEAQVPWPRSRLKGRRAGGRAAIGRPPVARARPAGTLEMENVVAAVVIV